MASKRAGMMARFFKRREQPAAVGPEISAKAINEPAAGRGRGAEEVLDTPVNDNAPTREPAQETAAVVEPNGAVADTGTPDVPPASGPNPVQEPEPTLGMEVDTDTPSGVTTDADVSRETTDVTASAPAAEPETTLAPISGAGTDGAGPETTLTTTGGEEAELTLDSGSLPEGDSATNTPENTPEITAAAGTRFPASTGVRELRVVTIVSLVEHAGAATVAAALGNRAEAKRWQIRATGPGLTRAAFSGMLTDTDALVLVSPADPASTSVLGENLRWLIANNRPTLPGRTIFVINLGSGEADALEVPADLENPLILLPLDPALALPAATPRAARRAARRAIDQLVEEISSILEEQN